MKCQLCDGQISGGRCRQCGMPYRNDELLYHLNEPRRAHEKHATEKAKEELRKRMIPLGDMVKSSADLTKEELYKRISASGNEAKKSSGRTAASQKTVSPQKTAYSQKTARSQRVSGAKKGMDKKLSQDPSPKKKSRLLPVFIILCFLIMFAAVIGKSGEEAYRGTSSYEEVLEPDTQEVFFSSYENDQGNTVYSYYSGYGRANVGTDIEPGKYMIFTVEEELEEELVLVRKSRDEVRGEEYYLTPNDYVELEFEEGDVLYFKEPTDDYQGVFLSGME